MGNQNMACNLDIVYVKENTTPHGDALSKREFKNETVENSENADEKILHRMETEVLSQDRLRID